jgi:cobalt-zinc-cadmium efflux system outer membrane protein
MTRRRQTQLGVLRAGLTIAVFAVSAPALHAQAAPQGLTPVAQLPSPPLTFEAALERALDNNPAIAAARLRRAIGMRGVDVAAERPNPEFRAELEKEAPKESYSLGVPLELGGKRGRRIAVGEAVVRTTEAEIGQTLVDVRAAVRRAYFTRVAAEARLTLVGELRDLAQRARDAAQQRFDAGSVPRLELVQAELALAQAENDRVGAQAAADAARVTLDALLGFPLDASPALVTPLDAGALPALPAALQAARSSNSELAVLDRRLDEQRARVALARSLQTPDVTPEATLTRRAEPEFGTGWRAAVGIALPVFTRHRAGVEVEQATLAQLELERAAALARIEGEVASGTALAAAQRQQMQEYRDRILPQALDVERMAEDAYRLGQTGISALLLALQATRDARLKSLAAAEQYQNALADLERTMGTTIR